MEIDIKEVIDIYKKREIASIYKYKYFRYVVEIGALRQLGVKHRLIADMLNNHIKDEVINRSQTSIMWKRWENLGYITDDVKNKINEYANKIKLGEFDEILKENYPAQKSETKLDQWDTL